MNPLSLVRSIYDLDTLDTRFTTPSSVPYKTVVDARHDAIGKRESATRLAKKGEPSKWRTTEFYIYYAVFIVTVPYMFWVTYDVSRRMRFMFYLPFREMAARKEDEADF